MVWVTRFYTCLVLLSDQRRMHPPSIPFPQWDRWKWWHWMSLSSFQLCRQMKMVSNTSQSNRSSRWTLKYFTRFLNVCKTLPRSPLKSEEDFKSNFHDRTTLDATHHLKMEVSHTRCPLAENILQSLSWELCPRWNGDNLARIVPWLVLDSLGERIWWALCFGWYRNQYQALLVPWVMLVKFVFARIVLWIK